MELMRAPQGPEAGTSSPHYVLKAVKRDEIFLERLIELLVLPLHTSLQSVDGVFFPHGREVEELHTEVQFCLWSMHIALSVYMKLLSSVDISVRQGVSDTISLFLANWTDGRGPALSNELDELIISQFREHQITDIPDMARLQKVKECASISSTVAAYIKDLTMSLVGTAGESTESTIEVLFPPSKNFIGRCFFPRLAVVSCKILELVRRDASDNEDSLCSAESTLDALTPSL